MSTLPLFELRTFALFVLTALCEIAGCYCVYLWRVRAAGAWLIVPAALALGAFAWLLTLHPTVAGRVYAAYGGVYVATAVFWLWLIDGVKPTLWDYAGALICIIGMGIIMFAPMEV